jgi:hypothetical protein
MLSEAIRYLLNTYKDYFNPTEPSSETTVYIHVDEVASKFAKFYEQIHNIVDYREEHLLRQHSISRSLQRDMLLHNQEDIAEVLIKEMIRAGHFGNDQIPEAKIAQVQRLVDNLISFIDRAKKNKVYRKGDLSSWLITVTASAIEECIDPPIKDRAAANAMFIAMKQNMVVTGKKIDDNEKDTQLFIGIQRALLRVDEDQLSYRLLKQMYPYWDNPTPEQFEQLANNLLAIKRTMDGYMRSPLRRYFFKICNQFNTVFLLLGDVTFNGKKPAATIEQTFNSESELASAITVAYGKRYEQQKRRLKSIAFLSVVSIFITKIIIALAVEIPIDSYLHTLSWANTVASIIFPPLLMIFIVALIRMPSKKNLDLVQAEVKAAVYDKYKKRYLLAVPDKRKRAADAVVNLLFLVVSIYILWKTWEFLSWLGFSPASSVVMILFTSIVAATGVRVNNRARDISVEPVKASFWSFIGDLLFMPFIWIGRLTISGLSQFKFLVVIVNLIDAPFQVLILFIESFSTFLRGKKEEIY